MRISVLAFVVSLIAAGCSIHAVNPHPTVVVGANATRVKLDASAIADSQKIPGAPYTILELRKSLENGLQNAAGEKYVPTGADSVLLKFTSLSFEINHALGNFISARFRAKWIAPNGEQIAEVAGTAQPHNPFENNVQRHFEDVLEVMYEKIVEGYDRTTHPAAPAPAGAALQ